MQSWSALFERAEAYDVDEAAINEALADVRDAAAEEPDDESVADGRKSSQQDPVSEPPRESSPARVVCDADVLAADLLVGGDARRALDHLRKHTWTTLLASDALLSEAAAVIAELADPDLAAAWRERVSAWGELVAHPRGDHPALATAYRGGAMHILSFDERLLSARAGAELGGRLSVSVRRPDAFATLFDAESLFQEVEDGDYPGPDRDPRA